MALPTILVNTTGGSDTQASGAGPGTALFGTTDASTDGAGTTVTLTAGTDLTGVATDGSHVIYLADTTAGARNFGKITGSAGSGGATPTVTVADAFGLNLTTKSWAIGGKRASIGSTTSAKLFSNNGTSGDWMPGWIVEMESGHTETIAAAFPLRRSGDQTNGPMILRGTAGAGTPPIITFSNNGAAFQLLGNYTQFWDFEIQNSHATKTASIAIDAAASISGILIRRMKIAHSTNKFWKGITTSNTMSYVVKDSCVGYTANAGVTLGNTGINCSVMNCWIHDCGAGGLILTTTGPWHIKGNLITGNTGDGVNHGGSGATLFFEQNTLDSNTGDGLEIAGASTNTGMQRSLIHNNIFSNNGGYGINFSGANMGDAALKGLAFSIEGNGYYNNSSGKYFPTTITVSESEQTTDPTFTNAAGNDYSIGTNLKAKGTPVGGTSKIGTTSNTYSYVDIGAAQRKEIPAVGARGVHIGGPVNFA